MLDAYHQRGVDLAVDLANTLRPVKGEDLLDSVDALRVFLEEHLPTDEAPTADDLDAVRAVRATVREALERAADEPGEVARLVNDGLRECRAVPQLRPDGDGWRLETAPERRGYAPTVAVRTLDGLAAVLVELGPDRLGVCSSPTCRATFADLSRNGSKQYCSRGCAHRASVAAYRDRRRPSS
ncbi:CGNR zinc finger domain-containing protein [Actinomycetospora endophytica]|uniref:CGNR zinc finger domain-containing protein n=1 Tax=Actinomycetospora endophytica TaxID=2291215 RepID=A0ABS8PC26_9PSEU|nr:CGNR zinc finger domain-containing protein [Actinomycetospora endophytica]MCD2195846.1 CGNR zinc finger domain-containing protein [Actinomycetospora endophytica]